LVRRRVAGYTLLEVVVAMAIFGIFLVVLGVLTSEMRAIEKRMPINFMRHPQIVGVIARIRRDVIDAHGTDPYPESYAEYTQSGQTLIVETIQQDGGRQTIVWDFRTPGEVQRHAFRVGVRTTWRARGVPADFSKSLVVDAVDLSEEDDVDIPDRPYGVRLIARDGKGRVAIDQILQPRAHE
jgi:prepilin-type N-terminal cleavage/methylation domain-containing protein